MLMAVEADELALRLKRISELTEKLMKLQTENDEARMLATRISQEIAFAREQLKRFQPM